MTDLNYPASWHIDVIEPHPLEANRQEDMLKLEYITMLPADTIQQFLQTHRMRPEVLEKFCLRMARMPNDKECDFIYNCGYDRWLLNENMKERYHKEKYRKSPFQDEAFLNYLTNMAAIKKLRIRWHK